MGDQCIAVEKVFQDLSLQSIPTYPVNVCVNIHLEKIYSLSRESTMEIVFFIESSWFDPRVPAKFENVCLLALRRPEAIS